MVINLYCLLKMKMVEHHIQKIWKVEIKDYNVKIDGKNFFDQPINNDTKTWETLEKLLLVKEMITQLVVC